MTYDADYELWLQEQIEGLKQGSFESLDIPHLIEELGNLNKTNKRELESYLIVLIFLLLKWEYQPTQRNTSWLGLIRHNRNRINKLFKQQPSLQIRLGELVDEAYVEAVEWASVETGIKVSLFPGVCIYLVGQLLDKNWLPD